MKSNENTQWQKIIVVYELIGEITSITLPTDLLVRSLDNQIFIRKNIHVFTCMRYSVSDPCALPDGAICTSCQL